MCKSKTSLEKIAQTQPSTTITFTSKMSYYQCGKCNKLYQEVTISDSVGRSTSSGIVKYRGNLTADELREHIPRIIGIATKESVNNTIRGNKK